jgi:hypothetical protein
MDQRISLITLGYRDRKRAGEFYAALGWTDAVAPDDDVVFFQAGGMVSPSGTGQLAADSGVTDGGGWGGVTLAYLVGSPEEVDAALAARRRRRSRAARRAARRPGAAIQGIFVTRRATRGRLRTIPGGPCGPTGRCSLTA